MTEQNSSGNGFDRTKVKEKLSELKGNIENFISDIKVDDLKKSFSMMMKEAQKDFNQLVDKDLEDMKKKFQKEKVEIEKKAKEFLQVQKKEISVLQSRLNDLMKKAKARTGKSTSKKATSKKASSKKTAKKATKKASKKS